MGLIKAFTGGLRGAFADQWIDFFTTADVNDSTVFFPAVKVEGRRRNSNRKGTDNIITNGSRILVPENYALITMENGMITAVATEPGGYIWDSNNPQSRSVFAGNGLLGSTFGSAWERFKFGGTPAAHQQAFYVSLKEVGGNRFGTQSEIYWDDAYVNAQVGALARGTYSIKVTDPILLIKNVLPESYYMGGEDSKVLDLHDLDSPITEQLFNEFVASLAQGFSKYSSGGARRMSDLQSDPTGLGVAVKSVVEEKFAWEERKGLSIQQVAIASIEYDANTKELLSDVKKADALSGSRSRSFYTQSLARGLENAGESGGGANIGMLGVGAGIGAGAGANLFDTEQQAPSNTQETKSPIDQIKEAKELLDSGIIDEDEFSILKKQILGN